MMRRLSAALLSGLLALAPNVASAKGGGHSSYPSGGGHHKAEGEQRNVHGKIARSGRARAEFKKSHPCPSTGRSSGGCPGYVVDHLMPLKRGGADKPSNMQWQTKAAAREKDKWE